MGTYTQIAKVGRQAAARRRNPQRRTPPSDASIGLDHVCPRCGDRSALPAFCDRCQVEMHDPHTSVALPPLEEPVSGRWVGWIVLLVGFSVLVGFSALYPTPTSFGRALEGPFLGLVASGTITMFGLALAAHLQPRWLERRRRRRFREALAAVEEARPVVSETPVRVCGKVGWRDAKSVWIETREGRVALPVEVVQARAEEGPRTYLRVGEEVEAVGRIRVAPGEAEGYRDSHALELHDEAVRVWVRRT